MDEMTTTRLLTWKNFRYVLVTVVLGAVGSGMWEWVLKPALAGTTNLVLDIATLGVQSFKDALYKEVALGLREEPSMYVYRAIYGFVPAALLGFASGIWMGISSAKLGSTESPLERATKRLVKPVFVLWLFLLVFAVVQTYQLRYVRDAIVHFNQLSAIAAPHVSEEQRLALRSRFAQVASRSDYESLVSALTDVCRSKNLRVPEFTVW